MTEILNQEDREYLGLPRLEKVLYENADEEGWAQLSFINLTILTGMHVQRIYRCFRALKDEGRLDEAKGASRQPNRYRLRRTPKCGTYAGYQAGCRCVMCKRGSYDYHLQREAKLWQPEDISDCLNRCSKEIGVPRKQLDAARETRTDYELHWAAWRASGAFRLACWCFTPDEVLESLEPVESTA